MKTAKSTTRKKTEIELARNIIADLGTQYLKNWTENELKKYKTTPVVIPIGTHGFLIGRLKITGIHARCWEVVQFDGKIMHHFVSKINAIVYCVNIVKQQYMAAQNLLDLDTKIGQLDLDILQYEHILSKTKDAFKSSVMLNRCINAKIERTALYNILKKTLNTAKYLNFGNKPL